VGRWTFYKLTVTKGELEVDSVTTEINSVFIFSEDGTYTETKVTPDKSKKTQSGKWKLIEGGKMVRLYNEGGPGSDLDLEITKFKGTRYLTYSWHDSPFAPETVFYKKEK
jgi:hypothetical protein